MANITLDHAMILTYDANQNGWNFRKGWEIERAHLMVQNLQRSESERRAEQPDDDQLQFLADLARADA
jgi:hypothetical protein